MGNAYDVNLRNLAQNVATEMGEDLKKGLCF